MRNCLYLIKVGCVKLYFLRHQQSAGLGLSFTIEDVSSPRGFPKSFSQVKSAVIKVQPYSTPFFLDFVCLDKGEAIQTTTD